MSNTTSNFPNNPNNNPLMNTASSKVFKSTDRKFSPISSHNENKVLSNTNTGSFYFLKRNEPLRWKEIIKLDIDRMIRKNNLSELEPHLQNLIFGLVDENDLEKVSDDNVVKLIKCFQYSLEFQFYYQQNLENHLEQVKLDYSNLYNDAVNKENFLKENKNLISILKKDKKEKEIVLHTYKALIDEFRRKNGIYNNNNSNNIQSIKTRGYYECHLCTGKVFDTEYYLNQHIIRRHPNNNQFNQTKKSSIEEKEKNSNDLNVSIVDRKINDLHKNFENYIKAFTDPMLSYVNTHKNIESQINEIKQESHYNKVELENQVKSVLLEIKEMYLNKSLIEKDPALNNTNTNFKGNENKEKEIKENNEKESLRYQEELGKLTSTLYNIKEQLDDIKKTQGVQKQALDFHTSQYLNDKKEREKDKERQNKFKETKDTETNNNKNTNKDVKYRLTAESQISYKSNSNNNTNNNNKEVVYKRKQFFNSGPLESDYDEEIETQQTVENKNIINNKDNNEKTSNEFQELSKQDKQEKEKHEPEIIKQDEVNLSKPEKENTVEKPLEMSVKAEEKEKEMIQNEIERINQVNVVAKKEEKPQVQNNSLLPPKSVPAKPKVDPLEKKKTAYHELRDNFESYLARDTNFEETGKMDMYKSIM